jgi:hypothetical protein
MDLETEQLPQDLGIHVLVGARSEPTQGELGLSGIGHIVDFGIAEETTDCEIAGAAAEPGEFRGIEGRAARAHQRLDHG